MSKTTGAGSTTPVAPDDRIDPHAHVVGDDIDLVEPGVSGAIDRARSRSESAHNPLEALPAFHHRLLVDRARAISQRDHARRNAAALEAELARVQDDLAAARAKIVELERDFPVSRTRSKG